MVRAFVPLDGLVEHPFPAFEYLKLAGHSFEIDVLRHVEFDFVNPAGSGGYLIGFGGERERIHHRSR